jgi:hypothetical protein
MRLTARILVTLVALVCITKLVHASTIGDPKMRISDPACTGEGQLVGTTFDFKADGFGGGCVPEKTPVETAYFSLDFETRATFPTGSVHCDAPGIFNTCDVKILAGGVTDIFLHNVDPSIPANTPFAISLDGWNSFEGFHATANLTSAPTTPLIPEPGTLLLLATGLLGTFAACGRARNSSRVVASARF